LKSFVVKINQEFNKSLPTINTTTQNVTDNTEDDADIEQLLFDEQPFQSEPETSQTETFPPLPQSVPENKYIPKMFKQSPEKLPEKIIARKIEKPKQQLVKIEKMSEQKPQVMAETEDRQKEYLEMETSAMYNEDEEQLDDDGNIFGEEIYDIMEIDHEGSDENIYLDDTGKQVLADDESEFILVNFKSSNEDLAEKEHQFVVEELYDDEQQPEMKPTTTRKKHVNRMPREIIEKYAQSTENNQHICTKCVKVFSTRTNLIRHIQSHDGYKAYVCQICQKGFTQSGSLKQHMYIHSGEVSRKIKKG
jgi:Zinc finger, C2H2 type